MEQQTVIENPRKISHEKAFERECLVRRERYVRMKEILEGPGSEGMKSLGFSDKALYKEYKKAFYLACLAHEGQTDKSGLPYVYHPVTAACFVKDGHEPSKKRDKAMICALLHDVLEDTTVTAKALQAFAFDEKLIKTVDILSRREDMTYESYMERVKSSKLAMWVKCGDLTDNENLSRLRCPTARDTQKSATYHRYRLEILEILRNA